MKNRNLIYIGAFAVVLIVIIIAVSGGGSNDPGSSLAPVESEPVSAWASIELTDVTTGESFTVSDFSDKPILLESFAVWCPTCTQQQKVIKRLHDEVGESIISISIDTDPNEDEERVLKHTQDNGFNWRYVVAPTDFTRSLIDQFGVGIVNAPSAPMVLICNGENARQLGSGVKSVETLKLEAARGC